MTRATWSGRPLAAAGVVLRSAVRVARWLLTELLWQVRLAWARLSLRARVIAIVVVLVLVLVLVSGWTSPIAPSISASAEALAVLVIAAAGFWMIVTSPRGRRR